MLRLRRGVADPPSTGGRQPVSKVAEYAVAEERWEYGSRIESLPEAVNRMIAEGWQPIGGIAFGVLTSAYYNGHENVSEVTSYPHQAMVRYAEDPPPVSPDDAPPEPQRCRQCGALDHNCPCIPF